MRLFYNFFMFVFFIRVIFDSCSGSIGGLEHGFDI